MCFSIRFTGFESITENGCYADTSHWQECPQCGLLSHDTCRHVGGYWRFGGAFQLHRPCWRITFKLSTTVTVAILLFGELEGLHSRCPSSVKFLTKLDLSLQPLNWVSRLLLNVGIHLSDYTVSKPRTLFVNNLSPKNLQAPYWDI